MLIQRLIWILGRMLFWMLLLPILTGIVYTLTYEKWWEALMFIVLGVIVLYKGLIRFTIQANSFAVRDGKVVFFFPKKTVRNRFDFVSRGQAIVHLQQYGLLDRPYIIEIFSPGSRGGVDSCRLSLNLGHVMELAAWQRAYDNFVRYQEQLPLIVKGQLLESSARMTLPAYTTQEEESFNEYLVTVVAELNLGLENLGLKIERAMWKFTAGSTRVRLIAAEQDLVEKAVLSGEAYQEYAELVLPAQYEAQLSSTALTV